MFGLLSRSNAVCRPGWAFRVIALGAQKSPQLVLRKVVLSGFPIALEPTLPPPLHGTNARTLPSDRKAGQLLLPRDDIPPPPPVALALEVCRLRLARIGPDIWFLLHSSSLKGAVWEDRREFFSGGIRKSTATEGKSDVMCDLQRMKSGKKPAAGRNRFLQILHKPPM